MQQEVAWFFLKAVLSPTLPNHFHIQISPSPPLTVWVTKMNNTRVMDTTKLALYKLLCQRDADLVTSTYTGAMLFMGHS